MGATATSEHDRAEAERQLSASAERDRVLASMQQLGCPATGQRVAVKAVGGAVQLVSFALKRAAEVGVPFERLLELTGWEPDLVRGRPGRPSGRRRRAGARAGGAPAVVGGSVGPAAAFDALARLQNLTQRMLADLDRDAATSSPLAPADLDELHDRWEIAWR